MEFYRAGAESSRLFSVIVPKKANILFIYELEKGGNGMKRGRAWCGRLAFFFPFAALSVVYAVTARDPEAALRLDRAVGAPLRALLSTALRPIPFSVTEWLLVSLPAVLLLSVPLAFLSAKSASATRRAVALLLLPTVTVMGLYVLTFAAGRHTPPIEERLALPAEAAPTAEEIVSTAAWLSALSADPPDYPGAAAVEAALVCAYRGAGERYGFTANAAVAVKTTATPLFLRLGYFGLYAFPLGEVTVTAECPPSTRTFTLAHEIAHASGFAREEEADLIALLTALSSADPYLTYAVAEGILGRFLSCLAVENPAVWQEISQGLSSAAREGLFEAGEVFEGAQAAETVAAETPDYSKTIRLTVALYRRISAQGAGGASIL